MKDELQEDLSSDNSVIIHTPQPAEATHESMIQTSRISEAKVETNQGKRVSKLVA